MKISAFEARVGNLIEMDGSLWKILNKAHVKPGKGGAFVQLELKDVVSGTKRNDRFRSEEKIEKAHVDFRSTQFLYIHGDMYLFMDLNTYEQIEIHAEELADQIGYMVPDLEVQINLYNGSAIGVELPDSVALEVIETESVVKGQTASGSGKPALLETGIRVTVPTFVKLGDRVRVNTDSGQYLERVN